MDKKKTLVSINMTACGSTGNIMKSLSRLVEAHGWQAYMAYPEKANADIKERSIKIGNVFFRKVNRRFAMITGYMDCFSWISTLCLVRKLKKIKPDILHLHNLHDCYLHMPRLFKYIKKNNVSVVWTLHDCWSFTGKCAHFSFVGCNKWKTGCSHCDQVNIYPRAYTDRTKALWKLKKKWFTGVENLTLVTPSRWLADLVGQSYLQGYPIKVINNGIDLNLFKPTRGNFRERHNLSPEINILLSIAFGWAGKKGLDVILELSKRLDPDKYRIVMVGTNEYLDSILPANIISIHRTNNQIELAEIYSEADLLLNATREDTFPTVNMEAIACGTPVLTFRTGGSPEILSPKTGSVVECNDVDSFEREIVRICESNPYREEDCLEHSKNFDLHERYEEYLALYESIINRQS